MSETQTITKKWQTIILGDYCKIYQPKTITSKEILKKGPFKVYGANGVIGFFNKYNHEDSEVLITCRGATCGRVNFSEPKSWITGNAMVVQPFDNTMIDKSFLYFKLLDSHLDILNTGSAQPQITRGPLFNFKIKLPPLPEQKTITHILSKIQEAIENQDKIIKTTTELKAALMKKIFSEGLNSESLKETEIGKIPKSWGVKKLGDLDLDISDGNYGEKYPRQSEFIKFGVPFIRANNMQDSKIVWDDMRYISEEKHKLLKKGHLKLNDILVTTRGDIGQVAFVENEFVDCNINAQIVRINTKEKINSKFFLYCLENNESQIQFQQLKTGSTLKQLPVGKLLQLRVALPSLSEQNEIAEILGTVDHKIEVAKKLTNTKSDLFKSMLNNLMSGETRVNNLKL